MTSTGFSDQYIVLDSFKALPESDLDNGELIFNLAVRGVTTNEILGINERLNRICEIEVEEFQFPVSIPYIQTAPMYDANPIIVSENVVNYGNGVIEVALDGPRSLIYAETYSANAGFLIPPSDILNTYNPLFNRYKTLFPSSSVATLPSIRTNRSVTSVSPITDVVTLYIKETGLQSISDLNNSRHNFNFKVSALENTIIYNATEREIAADTIVNSQFSVPYKLGLVPADAAEGRPLPIGTSLQTFNTPLYAVKNNISQYSIKTHTLKPTKSIYTFANPIMDISRFTLVFKNPDNPIAMYPSVYYNVPAMFGTSPEISTNIITDIELNTVTSYIAHLCYIIENHNLLPGDIIIVNDVTMVVYGSFLTTANPNITDYGSQLAKNVIVAQPLIYRILPIEYDVNLDTTVTIKIPKRRIRVPLRLRRLVDV